MSDVVRLVRFTIGLALVVAGVIAAGPYAASLVAAHGRRTTPAPPPETVAWVQQAAHPVMSPAAAAAAQFAQPGPSVAPQGFPEPLPQEPQGVPSAPFVPRGDYRPPTPPGGLPPVAMDLARPAPAIDAAYRSTLDVPPPPLLDVDTPPPLAVAWSANGSNAATARRAASMPQGDTSSYVVRDGDDLTGIAIRLYGHAGGAQAIWSVNRDRLSDPNVLPIGLELRIPPAWSVPAVQHDPLAGQVIEPGRRPTKVRVGPGETLESLAQRFYGDRAMAPRLFEANRDLLRNPHLLVAGMELRLP
ncbi:MAG: LysM peptidoglycan-binding domain-containing protein [Planctomycetia bacterium]